MTAKEISKDYLIEGYEIKKGSIIKSSIREIYRGKFNSHSLKEMTLYDFKASDITSEKTKIFKGARKDQNKTANINTKLISSEIINETDILFKFLTEASLYTAITDETTGQIIYVPYKQADPKHEYKRIIPGTDEMVPNPSKTYEIWIQVEKVLGKDGWLSVYDPEKEEITGNMIKDILKVADIKIFDDTPAYLYQGFAYALTQLDASIFPENRKPKRWDKIHGDGQNFLDKHLSQLFDQINFFIPQMGSSLTNLLRKEGIIKPYKRKSRAKIKESTTETYVVYHGSEYEFDSFDFSLGGSQQGKIKKAMHFTNNEQVAEYYGWYVYEVEIKIPSSLVLSINREVAEREYIGHRSGTQTIFSVLKQEFPDKKLFILENANEIMDENVFLLYDNKYIKRIIIREKK